MSCHVDLHQVVGEAPRRPARLGDGVLPVLVADDGYDDHLD